MQVAAKVRHESPDRGSQAFLESVSNYSNAAKSKASPFIGGQKGTSIRKGSPLAQNGYGTHNSSVIVESNTKKAVPLANSYSQDPHGYD